MSCGHAKNAPTWVVVAEMCVGSSSSLRERGSCEPAARRARADLALRGV